MGRLGCFLLVVALTACSPEIRDDWFLCDPSAGAAEVCPDGFRCEGGVCLRDGAGGLDAGRPDGAARTDAGRLDGSTTDDGAVLDASVDGGPVTCSGGTTDCFGSCVDLETDDDHCGMCGLGCGQCERCEGGACTAVSPGASCVDPRVPCATATCEEMGTLVCVPTPACSDGRGGGLIAAPGAIDASTCDGEDCVPCGRAGQACCANYGAALGGGAADRTVACESTATCPAGGTC